MMKAAPQQAHQWLHKLVGDWRWESECEIEPGKTALYHDVITFDGDDLRRLNARVRGNDGQWTEMMTMTYRRKK